ncbi:MAG: LLM class flavin-dependent oxidoreductase [Deltaproteobacteria bacterium]|nr:LLM class flavin-dependent oxidoreductase [Deltaproteobacteria bacterium]MBI3390628.1 LLM class flavin-dependent oxidoreductase [Deltaproteobacteria bacterium]
MKVGMNLPVMVPGLDRSAILEWARRIDAGPFTSLCAGERINFPNPEILITLSAAAAVTERVRIVPTVFVLPLHPPVLMAKRIATLDVLSAGRVVLGIGVGARRDDFVAACAVFDAHKLTRMEECVAIMRRVWAGTYIVEGAERAAEPTPVQPGGPEILVGALTAPSIRRAARYADGLCGFSFRPAEDEVRFAWDTARAAWRAANRDQPPRLTTSFWYALGPRARAQLDEYLHRYLNFMGADAARALAPTVQTTSAAALRDALKMLADLGTDEVFLVPTTADPDEVHRVADIIG